MIMISYKPVVGILPNLQLRCSRRHRYVICAAAKMKDFKSKVKVMTRPNVAKKGTLGILKVMGSNARDTDGPFIEGIQVDG